MLEKCKILQYSIDCLKLPTLECGGSVTQVSNMTDVLLDYLQEQNKAKTAVAIHMIILLETLDSE